jgi:hypothetical protein
MVVVEEIATTQEMVDVQETATIWEIVDIEEMATVREMVDVQKMTSANFHLHLHQDDLRQWGCNSFDGGDIGYRN